MNLGCALFLGLESFSSPESIISIPHQQRETPRIQGAGRAGSHREGTHDSVSGRPYDLVAQTAGDWVARYKKDNTPDQDRKKASDSAEIVKLRAEVRELRQENEFLNKAAAFFAKERP